MYFGNVVDFFQSCEGAECMALGCFCRVFIEFIPARSAFRAIEPISPLTGREEIQPSRAALRTLLFLPPKMHIMLGGLVCAKKTRPSVLFAVVPQLSKQFRLQSFPSTLIL